MEEVGGGILWALQMSLLPKRRLEVGFKVIGCWILRLAFRDPSVILEGFFHLILFCSGSCWDSTDGWSWAKCAR